ncbi:hypothetical protein Sango_2474500 [Sesamum angolense]|uniref:Uncharacterized protein n=1 Tax=Sesamum angolense TaxID=2727404 RepID=A0AAE1W3F9_9LAMI|nr:hypothetical protein Sango_2474500 [Sesamum angolense]
MEPSDHKEVQLVDEDTKTTTRIGAKLTEEVEKDRVIFLRKNVDIFAWSPSDCEGIDPKVIVHRLNVDLTSKPVKQKKRSFQE